MNPGGSGYIVIAILLVIFCTTIPGCITNHYTSITHQEIRTPSAIQCGSDSGISPIDQYDTRNLSPALKPGCLNCTQSLLTKPAGGFSGKPLLVGMVDFTGRSRTPNPDPHQSVNYTFYSRTMGTGTVRYTVSRVEGLYKTESISVPDTISLIIEPAEFIAEPGREYTSEMTVHVKPGTDLHENFWIHLHADVEGVPDAITDDWVRLALDDGGTMSGAGLWHFYRGSGGYCQKELVILQGGSGNTWFAVRTGELDTGNATLNLVTIPCHINHGPIGEEERPPWPVGIHATITPWNYTVRSFASYLSDMAFTVDPDVRPGDYCFSVISRTPDGGGDYAPFTVRVVAS
jgi:hypothetical protein